MDNNETEGAEGAQKLSPYPILTIVQNCSMSSVARQSIRFMEFQLSPCSKIIQDLFDQNCMGCICQLRILPRPMVQISLPPDYSCSIIGNGTADPGNESDLFVSRMNSLGYML